jgi:ribosome maturation protein SDO1
MIHLLSQALECIKALMQSSPLPVQKAEMKVRITMPPKDGKRLAEQVRGLSSQGGIEEDEMSAEEWEVVSVDPCPQGRDHFLLCSTFPLHQSYDTQIMRIPPENFRLLTDLMEKETKGKGRVESMGFAVVAKEEKFE